MSSKDAQNATQSASELARIIPKGATVAVTLSNTELLKPEWRGKVVHGFWIGIRPDPSINPIVLSPLEGMHWQAVVADPRSDQLVYDLHLATIKRIDVVSPEEVRP